MRNKAIQDLAQLSDKNLFSEIEEGAGLCISNMNRIHSDALKLVEAECSRGSEILRLAAEEEASKILILLDAVRCPRNTMATEFARQLVYFNDHLAKGIYAQYCETRPSRFHEVNEWVNFERKEYYLDGPNDIDWIFYNDILGRREETIYVEYVENDNKHIWHDPTVFDEIGLGFRTSNNPVIKLANALFDAGCVTSGALKIISEIWRPFILSDSSTWMELRKVNLQTLEAMEKNNILNTKEEEIYTIIINGWLFPLYSLDLRKEKIEKDELREIQKRWNPFNEYG